jgi:hypothetical protein
MAMGEVGQDFTQTPPLTLRLRPSVRSLGHWVIKRGGIDQSRLQYEQGNTAD